MLSISIRTTIQGMYKIAKQACILSTGLQNVAPPGTSLQSVQYLIEIAAQLEQTSADVEKLLQTISTHEPCDEELANKVLQLVKTVVLQDDELRKKYEMENKFRFVREHLQAIYQQLEEEIQVSTKQAEQRIKKNEIQDDEVPVYVYLYNVQGAILSSWQNLLTPKVFYEYSVNRPIYLEKSHIQTLLNSKKNKAEHAYIAVAIKTAYIIRSEVEVKDSLGNPLIKIKEGSLSFGNFLSLTYNDQEYILNNKRELIKKP